MGARLRRGCPHGAGRLGRRIARTGRRRGSLGARPGAGRPAGFVLELVAHTHDVAGSIGRTDLLDERLGNAALGLAERFLPPAFRSDGASFAEPVPVPPDADVYARLAGFLGRVPAVSGA